MLNVHGMLTIKTEILPDTAGNLNTLLGMFTNADGTPKYGLTVGGLANFRNNVTRFDAATGKETRKYNQAVLPFVAAPGTSPTGNNSDTETLVGTPPGDKNRTENSVDEVSATATAATAAIGPSNDRKRAADSDLTREVTLPLQEEDSPPQGENPENLKDDRKYD